MPRHPDAPRVDLTGKTVVVTGATPGGIGGETARLLTEWGADVVTTTRSGGSHPLDLTDRASVQAFAAWLGRTHERVDVLVNNAGVHLDLTSSWKQPTLLDGHEVHWRTNYLGTSQLTHLVLPQLLATPGARVVNVVSKLHHRGKNAWLFGPITPYSSWDAYGTSKLALVHATGELRRRYPVEAVAVHPGSVYTDIASKGLSEHKVLGAIRGALAPVEKRILLTATQGAQTSLYAASQPGLTDLYYTRCAAAPPSTETDDLEVAKRLWDETEAWVSGG